MKAEWMAQVGGEEYGPFTWDQMLQMAAEGRVTPELPIRKASDAQWSTAADIPGLLGAKPAAPAPKPAAKPAAPSAATPAGKSAVKKAKPLARPPSGRPVPPVVTAPQNIPAGIPVGAPVGTTPAAPLAPPPPPPMGAFNFDLGSSPGKPRGVKKSALDADDEEDVVVKKKSRAPLILGVLGGVTALVAVIVGITIYITMFRGGNEEQLAATNTSAETKPAKGKRGESNPGEPIAEGEADTGAKKPAAAKTAKSAAKTGATADQKATLQGIRDWKNIVTLKSVGVGNAKIAISRVWLADATGKRAVSPATDAAKPAESADAAPAEPKPDAPPAAPAKDGADHGKYLFVEIAISNKAGSPIKYKGWNNGGVNGAILADDQNQIFPLVPNSATTGVERLTTADVPGGRSIVETLVFEAPAGSFDALHLALPQAVFYPSMKGKYFALEITPDVLSDEGGPPVVLPPAGFASGDNDPLLSGRRVATDPALPESPAEPPKPEASATKTEPPPPKKPSLIDEINKSVDEDEKGKKMDEGKGAEAEKKPEPGKKGEPAKKPEPAKKTAPAKGKK